MNSKYMFIVAAMEVMLVGATAFATDSAFADEKKRNMVRTKGNHKQMLVEMINYQRMSSAKTPVHKFREKRTQ
jgi:hypothetical protein